MYNGHMNKVLKSILLCLLLIGPAVRADSFDSVKEKLARSGCHYFEFYSIIESAIFGQGDTVLGMAHVAADGRYNITIAGDHYVFDLKRTYTYSESTGQVIIETVDPSASVGEEISFILRLDETYHAAWDSVEHAYRLQKREESATVYPDSLRVKINAQRDELKQLEYFDVNEELNRIEFLKYDYQPDCDSSLFRPSYPDSTEVIRL